MRGHKVLRTSTSTVAAAAALALAACGGGDVHPLGEEVVVGYTQSTGDPDGDVSTTLAVTVLDVRQGTQAELAEHGFEVDAESRNTVPHYIDVRYENRGENAIQRNVGVSLEDTDGNLLGSTLIFNYGDRPYPPCQGTTDGELAPGESYESCTLVLVPEGVEVGSVSFLSYPNPGEEPEFVYWDIE